MKVQFVFAVWLAVTVHPCALLSLPHYQSRAASSPKHSEPLPSPKVQECVCTPHLQCNVSQHIDSKTQQRESTSNICDEARADCCKAGAIVSACGRRPLAELVSQLSPPSPGQALYGEFPWMVAVLGPQYLTRGQHSAAYYCGGSLITPRVILTAAHCVKGKSNISIRVGEWSVANLEPHPVQNKNVNHVVVHEEYSAGALFNDIALLFLESAVEMADNVATVCLPEQGATMDQRNCVASGWGKDVFGEKGRYQDILKKVEVGIVDRALCHEQLRNSSLGEEFTLHQSLLCAGGQRGRDMCQGDGGSPLVCPSSQDPSVFLQAGIVTWGVGCGSQVPGAYVNVAHFRTWIDKKITQTPPN